MIAEILWRLAVVLVDLSLRLDDDHVVLCEWVWAELPERCRDFD